MDVFLNEDEELLENIRVFGIEPAKLLNKSLIVKLSRKKIPKTKARWYGVEAADFHDEVPKAGCNVA